MRGSPTAFPWGWSQFLVRPPTTFTPGPCELRLLLQQPWVSPSSCYPHGPFQTHSSKKPSLATHVRELRTSTLCTCIGISPASGVGLSHSTVHLDHHARPLCHAPTRSINVQLKRISCNQTAAFHWMLGLCFNLYGGPSFPQGPPRADLGWSE